MDEIAPPLGGGRYKLVGVLGRGGNTTVYRAIDSRSGEERAIKVLPPARAGDPKHRTRFFREAEALAVLHHPHVVPVHDFGEESGQLYLVMELMPGGSVARAVRRFGPLSEHGAVTFLLPILGALQLAHSRGVVHRDVKPGNILLDAKGQPRLGDFGIARLGSLAQITAHGAIMGSWPFMSPEQRASARDVDARSDLFSAGATLYAMCRGVEPREIDQPEPRERFRLGVSPQLWDVIGTATERDPAKRFPSARRMADALLAVHEELSRESPQGKASLANVTFDVDEG